MANNVTPLISIGKLVDQSWETYRDHFKPLMRIALWFFLPALLYIVSKIILPFNAFEESARTLSNIGAMEVARSIIGGGISMLTSLIVMPLVSAWVFVATAKMLKEISKKQTPLNEQQITQSAKTDFLPYLLQVILLFVISILTLVPMIPGFALILVNLYAQGGRLLGLFSIILMILGTLTSIVLAIRVAVMLAFSGFALTIDAKKPIEGIKTSYALVKGHFFGSLWRMIVPALVFGVIPVVIETGAVVLFSLLAASLPTTNDMVLVNVISLFGTLIATGVNALIAPLPIAANYFLYESLKRSQDHGNV